MSDVCGGGGRGRICTHTSLPPHCLQSPARGGACGSGGPGALAVTQPSDLTFLICKMDALPDELEQEGSQQLLGPWHHDPGRRNHKPIFTPTP